MKIFLIIIVIIIIVSLGVVLVLLFRPKRKDGYHPSSSTARAYFEKLDSEFIKLIKAPDFPEEVRKFDKLRPNTILVALDDPDGSCDQIIQDTDSPNIVLYVRVPEPNLDLGHWLYKSLRSRCRIVNFFTSNLCDEWRNFLHTVRQQGLEDLMVVFPLDKKALKCVQKEGVSYRTDLIASDLPTESSWGSAKFKHITVNKVKAIEILLREGYFVFYFDSDIVLLRDPIQDYFSLPPKEIYMQSDMTTFQTSDIDNYCTGVMFIAPSLKIADKMRDAVDLILKVPTGGNTDQAILNKTISNIGVLDPAAYPNGARYFREREKCDKKPVLVHNNFVAGVEAKIKRFKEHGLWYI